MKSSIVPNPTAPLTSISRINRRTFLRRSAAASLASATAGRMEWAKAVIDLNNSSHVTFEIVDFELDYDLQISAADPPKFSKINSLKILSVTVYYQDQTQPHPQFYDTAEILELTNSNVERGSSIALASRWRDRSIHLGPHFRANDAGSLKNA